MLKKISICLFLLITVYTRFVNLNWDRGWGFHPDENNLWGASRSIKWFSNIDPKFYAYGGFPIYLYSFFNSKVQARAVSAFLQIIIIGLLFLIGKKLKGNRLGFIAALIGIFSAGLVQAAHFLTVESILGFLGLAILFCLLNYDDAGKRKNLWLLTAAVVLGLGIGTKMSFAVFGLPFFGRALIFLKRKSVGASEPRSRALARHARRACEQASVLLGLFIIAVSIFILTNPFILSKFQDVKSTLRYETNVAMGNLPVFYTRQFTGTVPGWFQAVHIFPFITGWLFIPMFLVGVSALFAKVRPWRMPRPNLLMLLAALSALLSFLPIWAKWTRYVVQILPILILAAAIGADWIWEKGKVGKAVAILAIISFLPQFFSVIKVYGNTDNRLAVADWAVANIPKKAKIFTEGMDLGIIPFNPIHGENTVLFNFYELDEDKTGQRQILLNTLINENEYFISVSNRVYGNSLRSPDKFPASSEFYNRLFDGTLGYQKIYESPSVVIPAKAGIYLNRFPVKPGMTVGFAPEETFQVFDHPKIMIFQKVNTFLRS
ncbi:glycosyltransferase family 39 protein [Candidatus Collierbacteria bacterium]|nr:glycosyltransferase family 39 protein [Candidatus Collierbacteria bacterium]